MGSENSNPLEELKRLDGQIDSIQSLPGLQPLFARLEEITRTYSGNFEVQLVAHEVKQHFLARGLRLKEMAPPASVPVMPPIVEPVGPVPPLAQPSPPAQAAPAMVAEKPKRKRGLIWIAAGLAALALIAVAVSVMRERNLQRAQTTPVDAGITTVPPGAAIRIDGQQSCSSDCIAKLVPGDYRVEALMDGYEPASAELKVTAGQPAQVTLTLVPQATSVRIFADLGTGQVFLDDKPAGELQDGQFTLERIEPGQHTVRVSGGASTASFHFNAAPAQLPAIEGEISTNNLLAVLISNLGDRARAVTSAGPLKLTVNGQTEADVSPAGVDLTGFRAGAGELVVGEGTSQRTITGTFTNEPALTAYLKTDQKIGTLIVATGEDDVRIFVNDREQRRKTAKGIARIQTFGNVTVRVEKAGFEVVPPQKVNVAQGAEARVSFTMKALPMFSALSISGGAQGTRILIDDRQIGVVGAEGSFRNTSITPGEHSIELRRDQFEPRRITRTFRAGETVIIGVAESTLVAVRPPPPPPVVIAPPAPPKPAPAKPAPPKAVSGDISNFDTPGAWKQVDGVWRHQGAATLTYALPPNGIFTFSIYMLKGGSILRGGRVRWFLNYIDAKNYARFELDAENFWSIVVVDGKTLERKKVAHKQDKSMRVWNIQIDASPTRLVHKIQGDEGWVDLDSWAESGRDFTRGQFGILVTGSDEVGLSNFRFTPH